MEVFYVSRKFVFLTSFILARRPPPHFYFWWSYKSSSIYQVLNFSWVSSVFFFGEFNQKSSFFRLHWSIFLTISLRKCWEVSRLTLSQTSLGITSKLHPTKWYILVLVRKFCLIFLREISGEFFFNLLSNVGLLSRKLSLKTIHAVLCRGTPKEVQCFRGHTLFVVRCLFVFFCEGKVRKSICFDCTLIWATSFVSSLWGTEVSTDASCPFFCFLRMSHC